MLKTVKQEYPRDKLFTAYQSVLSMELDGEYSQDPRSRQRLASHDNLTGIMYLIEYADDDKTKKDLSISHYIKYQQVFWHILSWKYKSEVAQWISSLSMLFSCRRNYRSKNGKWDTDGKLLSLLKIATIELQGRKVPLKKQIIKAIKKHWGERYIHSMMLEAFSKDHPLVKESHDI